MPFALTPASGQAIRPPEPVDVAAIDFIVDPAVWTVTRGVGENSHIVTLKIIEAPSACLFLDQFLGAAGPITGHTPDTAPVGFAWTNGTAMPNSGVILTGSGSIVATPIDPSYAVATANNVPTTMTMTFPYVAQVVATASDIDGEAGVQVVFSLDANSSVYLKVIIASYLGSLYSVDVEVFNTVTGGFVYYTTGNSAFAGERDITVLVEEEQITVTVNGVSSGVIPNSFAGALPNVFDIIVPVLDRPSTANPTNISLIRLCNGTV